jgi:hypothetical protein
MGYVAGGDDCSAHGEICSDGACKPVVCPPNARSCDGDAISHCNTDGTRTFIELCAAGSRCQNGDCIALNSGCIGNGFVCKGKELRQCNAQTSETAVQRVCTADETCDALRKDCALPGTCGPDVCPSCSLGSCCSGGLCGCVNVAAVCWPYPM